MESEIDGSAGSLREHRFPVKSLMERYNITRSVLYNRFKGLGIIPTKFGRQSYVTGEELALLDQLHEYIQAGGYITGFIREFKIELRPERNLRKKRKRCARNKKQNAMAIIQQQSSRKMAISWQRKRQSSNRQRSWRGLLKPRLAVP